MFITVEGVDGVGKTTQATMLADRLRQNGINVLLTKEPGSPYDSVCESIRSILLNPDNVVSSRAALFLFLADRAQHIETIKKALNDSLVVISDRSSLSSFVYHTAERRGFVDQEQDYKLCEVLDMAQQISPDLCFICSADMEWSASQLIKRKQLDRIEKKSKSFHSNTHLLFGAASVHQICKMMQFAPKKILFAPSASENSKEFIADGVFRKTIDSLNNLL